MNDSSLITIATYSLPYEAHIAKASLESEGIPSFVFDEHLRNLMVTYALCGIRLQVAKKHAKEASKILNQDLSHLLEEEFGKEEYKCKRCGSTDLVPFSKRKITSFIILLLIFCPHLSSTHGLKCQSCGELNKS
ncbi:MAG: phosphoenolpyruvate synthase [Planctomycetota bacterium]|nr:MAG: phosphoenolpyruvate synthase [Planctomycetota bacterium]